MLESQFVSVLQRLSRWIRKEWLFTGSPDNPVRVSKIYLGAVVWYSIQAIEMSQVTAALRKKKSLESAVIECDTVVKFVRSQDTCSRFRLYYLAPWGQGGPRAGEAVRATATHCPPDNNIREKIINNMRCWFSFLGFFMVRDLECLYSWSNCHYKKLRTSVFLRFYHFVLHT